MQFSILDVCILTLSMSTVINSILLLWVIVRLSFFIQLLNFFIPHKSTNNCNSNTPGVDVQTDLSFPQDLYRNHQPNNVHNVQYNPRLFSFNDQSNYVELDFDYVNTHV